MFWKQTIVVLWKNFFLDGMLKVPLLLMHPRTLWIKLSINNISIFFKFFRYRLARCLGWDEKNFTVNLIQTKNKWNFLEEKKECGCQEKDLSFNFNRKYLFSVSTGDRYSQISSEL